MKVKVNVSKYLLAILLIGTGVVFLLNNFGVIETNIGQLLGTYWPIFMMVVGVWIIISPLFERRKYRGDYAGNVIIGSVIALLGWNFLAKNLGLYTISFSLIWNVLWPSLLIYIGFRLLYRKKREPKWHRYDDKSGLDGVHFGGKKGPHSYKGIFIGDLNMGKEPFELKDLHIWNGVGDIDLDLTRAVIPDGESNILITGWIGDVEIIVPKDMFVWIESQIRIGEIEMLGNSESGLGKEQSYKSVGYDDAEQKVHIVIEQKIGDIRVIRK